MEYKRPHPINIVESTGRFWVLLLLPVIRGFLLSGGAFSQWVSGAWFDILVVAGIICLGVVSWYFNTYAFDGAGIYVSRGVLIKRKFFIPYERLATLSVEFPFYLAPFKAVHVNADTDAGFSNISDFTLTMRKTEAEELIKERKLPYKMNDRLKRVYRPKGLYVAILSVITSNTLTGVLFFSALISQAGNLLGQEFEDMVFESLTNIAKILAFGIPPAAAIIAYVLLGGWLVSFVMNLIRNKDFEAIRQGGVLEVSAGIITPRYYSITTKRVNLTEIHQSLLTKLFGFYSVYIHSSGYGKQKNSVSVLIPAADKFEARRNMGVLLPEIPMGKKQIRPSLKTLTRFLIPPLGFMLGFFIAFAVGWWLFPSFREIILFLGIMAELPSVWWLFVKIASFGHTGIGLQNGVYTLSCTYAYGFYITSVPIRRITQIKIRQSIFQKMSNCCDVIVYAYSEGRKRRVVNNIPILQAYDMFGFEMNPAERQKVAESEKKQSGRFGTLRRIVNKIRAKRKRRAEADSFDD